MTKKIKKNTEVQDLDFRVQRCIFGYIYVSGTIQIPCDFFLAEKVQKICLLLLHLFPQLWSPYTVKHFLFLYKEVFLCWCLVIKTLLNSSVNLEDFCWLFKDGALLWKMVVIENISLFIETNLHLKISYSFLQMAVGYDFRFCLFFTYNSSLYELIPNQETIVKFDFMVISLLLSILNTYRFSFNVFGILLIKLYLSLKPDYKQGTLKRATITWNCVEFQNCK